MRYYLIGHNIKTSLSPQIHNLLFKLKNLPHQYQINKTDDPMPISQMNQSQFGGMSITIPYKKYYENEKLILPIDQLAQKYKIINTVVKRQKGILQSYNTDIFGIQKCLDGLIERVEDKNALIIGAGATAEIFCYYFKKRNISTAIINRTPSRVETLKTNFPEIIQFIPKIKLEAIKKPRYSIIINSIPMQAIYDNWNYIEDILHENLSNFSIKQTKDIVYMNVNYRYSIDPIQQLLKKCFSIRMSTAKGIDMLAWQAIEQNRHFNFEQSFDEDKCRWLYDKLKSNLNIK